MRDDDREKDIALPGQGILGRGIASRFAFITGRESRDLPASSVGFTAS
ncbi:hypothetical protein IC614_09105 [Allosphingosinicella flava]|uniref:Uncharacterized protein n=1 Tax=Allosphingosinicella flava TaxID=2771430 RepID=A0A7T2GII1_9SPHN|nr:hypothetical protein IC614_09105 [Sphingosinicella flava]